MAVTPHPLVWDFYRSVEGASGLGGVVHYYDESSQSLWLSSGIKTNLADIPEGHWETASVKVAQSIGTPNYSSLELDHAYNGVLFGVAKLGNKIEYLRYVYSFDCSDIISSGSMNYDENNNTSQIQANLMNINKDIFINESTVFQPGARINFKIIVGNETPIDMFTGYLDSVDFNISSKTVPISGRNNIGFKLTQSTFDTNVNMLSNPYDAVNLIANLGNISKIIVQNTSVKRRFIFKPDQTLMSGLEQITELFSDWKIIELPDGTIVVGSSSFIKSYQNTGYYIFKKDSLFKRKIKKSCDASYTKVRVTGKDENDKDLTPVTVNVNMYNQWELPTNKTYHETAPDGLTQSELESYANEIAQRLQYIGIGEDFTCSLQPQICIGDIAAVDNEDNTSTVIGLITSIKHKFGKSGFFTEFSTDSGGLTMEEDGNLSTYTKKYLNGYNRKQTLKDLIQVASGSSNAGPKTSGTVVKVSTNSNASTLEGKNINQIIDMAVNKASQEINAVPEYTIDDYGKFLTPTSTGLAWMQAESGGEGGEGPFKVVREYIKIEGSHFNTQSDTETLLTVDGGTAFILMYDLGLIGPHYVTFAAKGVTGKINRQRVCFSDIDIRTLTTGSTFASSRLANDASNELSTYTFNAFAYERYAYIYLNNNATAQEYNSILIHT